MTYPATPTDDASAIAYARELTAFRGERFTPIRRIRPLQHQLNFAAIKPDELPTYQALGWELVPDAQTVAPASRRATVAVICSNRLIGAPIPPAAAPVNPFSADAEKMATHFLAVMHLCNLSGTAMSTAPAGLADKRSAYGHAENGLRSLLTAHGLDADAVMHAANWYASAGRDWAAFGLWQDLLLAIDAAGKD